MTNKLVASPMDDDDESAGKQRTTDEILAELAVKQKRDKKLLAKLIEVAAQFEEKARRVSTDEEERGGR